MFQVFRNAWMDTQLRKKILYTLFIIVLFRLGSNIFVPFLDNSAISTMMGGASLLNYLDVMTGGSLGKGTLLAMSITPYINASIIIQLLAVAIPPLEKLQKEGEEGRKKLNTITKFTSLALAILQAIAFYFTLRNGYNDSNGVHTAILKYGDVREANPDMFAVVLSAIVIVACFVAGASMIIWLGDRQRYLYDTFRRYRLWSPQCSNILRIALQGEPRKHRLRSARYCDLHCNGMVRYYDDQRRA